MTEPSLLTHVTSIGTVVWVLQEMKKAGWCKFINMDTTQLNRLFSAIAALATGFAIHFDYNAVTGTLTSTITGLTVMSGLTFLWGAAQQFVGQEMLYQLVYAPKTALIDASAKVAVVQRVATGKVIEAVQDVQETVNKNP